MKLQGCTALVTGANRGIGKAFVEALHKAGAKKIYAAARNLDALKKALKLNEGIIVPLELDITKPEQIRAAIKEAGDIDLLINNAGVLQSSPGLAANAVEAARKEMDVNYFGTLQMCNSFAPVLKKNGGGAIINILSIASLVPFHDLSTYCASKAASHILTQCLRAELAGQGTRVVGVYPGPIDTDMAKGIDMEKAPASQVAEAALEAVRRGTDDVFPDEFSTQMHEQLLADAKAVEEEMAKVSLAS